MHARALVIAGLITACRSPSHLCDAAPPFERALNACKHMGPPTGELHVIKPYADDDGSWLNMDHDVTIRVLSTDPFLFQTADPGTRKHGRWYQREISPAAVSSELAALPFGAVVRVHYKAPPIMNSNPPPYLSGIAPGATPAAEAALLAEWHPAGFQSQIQVYADGHALVTLPHHFIDATLSQPELDDLLDSFARARFDTLPPHPYTDIDRAGRVVLLCQRYQQVDLDANALALAPVVSAFERIRDRALARARPVLRVADTGWHPQIFAWPATAPRLDDNWYSLKFLAAAQAAAGDGSSPMYRTLPDDLAVALAAVKGSRRVIVREHGVLWGLAADHCATCRPGTYSVIVVEKESWDEAPAWAPDLASIGADGLWLDGQDPRFRTLDRQYRQRGEIFAVEQAEAIPEAKR